MMKNLLFVLFVAFILVGCGNGGDEEKTATQNEKKTAPSSMFSKEAQLTLLSDDLMKYDKDELRVKAGQKVTLTLKHTGKLDKTAMGHNFVLLQPGTDIMTFAAQAAEAQATDYIPEDQSAIIAHTSLIGGGETTSVTFDAPPTGTYDFICSFPGHAALMKGKFIVE